MHLTCLSNHSFIFYINIPEIEAKIAMSVHFNPKVLFHSEDAIMRSCVT